AASRQSVSGGRAARSDPLAGHERLVAIPSHPRILIDKAMELATEPPPRQQAARPDSALPGRIGEDAAELAAEHVLAGDQLRHWGHGGGGEAPVGGCSRAQTMPSARNTFGSGSRGLSAVLMMGAPWQGPR